jgi:hypothetical protein
MHSRNDDYTPNPNLEGSLNNKSSGSFILPSNVSIKNMTPSINKNELSQIEGSFLCERKGSRKLIDMS